MYSNGFAYVNQRMEPGPTHGACLHTAPSAESPHGRMRPPTNINVEDIKRVQKEARTKSTWASDRVGYPTKDNRCVVGRRVVREM